ncbi:MAG: NADH:flavin oxidoreductase [Acidobacteriota bacterium]|nr:NADH:flavin oxidoreductase [Acidobacteriota bacterium]
MSCLFSECRIASLGLGSRLVTPPMASGSSDVMGLVTERTLSHYQKLTKSEKAGLVIVEHSFVDPAGRAGAKQLSSASDEAIPGLVRLAETIKGSGARAVLQISHAGMLAPTKVTGVRPVGPSALIAPASKEEARALESAEIAVIVRRFAAAARRAQRAGFDAVEIHAAHSYLLNTFFSPITNQRTDTYGGTVENRARITCEVLAAVRATVGEDFPVLVRFGTVDGIEGGSTVEDSSAAAPMLVAAGADALDVSEGLRMYQVSGYEEGQGRFARVTRALRAVVDVPVIMTGGVDDPVAAEELLASGACDLVGVGRAQPKDPLWAQRAAEQLG